MPPISNKPTNHWQKNYAAAAAVAEHDDFSKAKNYTS